ncbi:MAG: hypothetical protein ACI9XZ_004040 [Alphaproteobacteria bacterium]|jgi:hypothetical protein
MAKVRDLVLQSIETADGDRCVDIFRRGDGSFGFEGYRWDAEDTSGWFRVTQFGEQRYDSEAETVTAARGVFPWMPVRILGGS